MPCDHELGGVLAAGVATAALVEEVLVDRGRLLRPSVTARFSLPNGSKGFRSSTMARLSATATSGRPAPGSATAVETAESAKMDETMAVMCIVAMFV